MLTLAGGGSRFRKSGYSGEKFLLPIFDKTILESIIINLKIPRLFDKVIVVRREQIRGEQGAIVRAIADRHGFKILEIDFTKSQYCTVVKGLQLGDLSGYDVLFIHNGDTVIDGINLDGIAEQLNRLGVGFVDTFKASSADLSYVICNGSSEVIEIREKEVISNQASSGLYGFPGSIDLACCANFHPTCIDRSELYISDVIGSLIKSNNGRFLAIDRPGKTWILGTPDSYEALSVEIK